MSHRVKPDVSLEVYRRCRWTCVYCGFDGQSFNGWMQLTLDHLVPQQEATDDTAENLVACCQACNSITNKMKFGHSATPSEILAEKQTAVRDSRIGYFEHWQKHVWPHLVGQPLLFQLDEDIKIGQLVRETFSDLLNSNCLTDAEIKELCDKDYCKIIFDLNYAVLKESCNLEDRFDDKQHARYYSQVFQGKYLLCNDWYERNRQGLEGWLVKHRKN